MKSPVKCDFKYNLTSSCSETSNFSSSSDSSDTPLKRFNRLVRKSVARWAYFRRKPRPWTRGRSVSDTGLCDIVHHGTFHNFDLAGLCKINTPLKISKGVHIKDGKEHCAFEVYIKFQVISRFKRIFRSAGGSAGGSVGGSASGSTSALGLEEASDSDAERPRRHHLRVPTPHYHGQSTGNFAGGAAGGGGGAPRSAPATPLQLEPHPRHSSHKHDKHVVKPLSGSAPSVRVSALGPQEDGAGGGAVGATGAADGKPPGKARQKKFQRHFPQVGPDERVLNYYSCALVGDLLLQGHLYITKNYFAFYSNVFGYVTKLLIPTTSVLRITKEKVARIIPNAVGVCTRDERHVFGSLLSRDSTYKLMMHVWKAARLPELAVPPPQELRSSEVELEASEYSPEDDSSSAGADHTDAPTRDPTDPLIAAGGVGGAVGGAVIQPALLTGGACASGGSRGWQTVLALLAALLALSAAYLAYRLAHAEEPARVMSGGEVYAALVSWRSRLHGRAADELHSFLSTNLLLLTKVRQSLETLSGVILTDMGHDVPNDTAFS
ncbi:uncharacterized protein LOC106716357 [Papilio machaon]|uniref:uncharacterized protein LOC106716357 n=1 Tax=Papilio machaon TaxID=76193 RepID=UPI001E662EDF|nr:uncharacterized protein LOC106716357 [Papilio machaon]